MRMLNQTETVTQVGAIHTYDNTLFPQSDDSSMHQPKKNITKYGPTMEECLKIFNDNVALGPIYVCPCCLQTWFRGSVHKMKDIKLPWEDKQRVYQICQVGWTFADDIEWICCTCRKALGEAKIPKLSIYNKLGFPEQPPELKCYPPEEWLVAFHIPFMQIRDIHTGGQKLVCGIIINVPVDIAPTVNTLPRHMNDTQTIAVKFKWKKNSTNIMSSKKMFIPWLCGKQQTIYSKTVIFTKM